MIAGFTILSILKMLFAGFNGVLFTQSGFDKILDYKGNRSYFQDHFKNSPLAGTVGILLPVILVLETAAGLLSLVGLAMLLFMGDESVAPIGMLLGSKAILSLFLGQRVAKDYAGAATLVPYFLMTTAGLALYLL
ncbi:MAG: DoxX family protein [Spirosomataceae bacterium]